MIKSSTNVLWILLELIVCIGFAKSEAGECVNSVNETNPLTLYDDQGNVLAVVTKCRTVRKNWPEQCDKRVETVAPGEQAIGGEGGRCCRGCCRNYLWMNETVAYNGEVFTRCRDLVRKYPQSCALYGGDGGMCCRRCRKHFNNCPLHNDEDQDSFTCNLRKEYTDCQWKTELAYNTDQETGSCKTNRGTVFGRLDEQCFRCLGSNTQKGCRLHDKDFAIVTINVTAGGIHGDLCMTFDYCHDDANDASTDLFGQHVTSSGEFTDMAAMGALTDCDTVSHPVTDLSPVDGIVLLVYRVRPGTPVSEDCFLSIGPIKFTKGSCPKQDFKEKF